MSEEKRPIRVGIVGVGWGSVVQVPAFRMVPAYEVVALCSQRQESVAAAGEKLGIADVSTDWKAFVQRDDLDVVSICTPVDLHREQALAAIAAGKHVLVEKPVGLDSTQTGEMLAAAEAAGVAHAVCFEGRWGPARYAIWQAIREGRLGDPYFALARSGADYWHPTRGLQSEWMYAKDRGGGYLMGMGSHDIDFICALFGEPAAVTADVRSTVPRRPRADGSLIDVDADDTSVLTIRMRNGMIVSIVTTAVAYGRSFHGLDLAGSLGSLSTDGPLMGDGSVPISIATVGTEGDAVLPASVRMAASGIEPPKRRAGAAIQCLALMLEDWVPALSGATTLVPSLRDGHRVQRVVDAARASSAGGGWVEL
jgi:predicted dehydrogenase